MKRMTGVVVCSCFLLVTGWLFAADPPPAADDDELSADTATPSDSKDLQYVGAKKCKMCHSAWHESWLESPKGARAWDALKPSVDAESKIRAALDPQKDYTTDATCLTCHAVGFGHPGGYQVPNANDAKSVRVAASREGVGCESCHGPGGGYTEVMQDIQRNKRTYTDEELHAAGLRKISVDQCNECHNDQAICVVNRVGGSASMAKTSVEPFGAHAHFPLKLRTASGDRAPGS